MNVSVIIPAYNAEATIEKAIISVFNQGMNNCVEIIVINDGSTDSTKCVVEGIIEKSPPCNVYIYTQENRGVASARNEGVRRARFELIAFLDSDDEWVDGKLLRQVDFLYRNNDFALVAGNLLGLNANFKKLKMLENGAYGAYYEVSFHRLLLKHYFQPSTVLMRKSVFNMVGGFKDGMTHAEEGLLFYNVAYSYRCAIDESITINYGDNKHSFASSGLASNLRKMRNGEIQNLREIYFDKKISFLMYVMLYLYMNMKFIRRLIIKKMVR